MPNGSLNHLFLWGSSGTGKTLLLVETLRIMMAHYKLQKKELEVIVLVYHDHVEEHSELMKDFKTKYLSSIKTDEVIKSENIPTIL